ncbi:MAG: helix-turn-helix domain-containing protein [Chloroflexota bacterium]
MTDFDDILTVQEAAEYLKLAQSTIYRLCQNNQLPARKIGGAWRLSRRGLDEWIANYDNPAWYSEMMVEDDD